MSSFLRRRMRQTSRPSLRTFARGADAASSPGWGSGLGASGEASVTRRGIASLAARHVLKTGRGGAAFPPSMAHRQRSTTTTTDGPGVLAFICWRSGVDTEDVLLPRDPRRKRAPAPSRSWFNLSGGRRPSDPPIERARSIGGLNSGFNASHVQSGVTVILALHQAEQLAEG